MKIAYLLGSLNRGGLETLILDTLNNHAKAKFEMICVHRKRGGYYDDFNASSVPIFEINAKELFGLKFIFRLRRLLLTEKVDIIHAQTALDSCLAYLATFGTKIKLVSSFHCFSFKPNRLASFALKYSDLNIFVSDYQKKMYEDVYSLKNKQKNVVVYNGVNFEKILGATHQEIDFISNGRSKNRLQICMVGNFVRGREQNTVCIFLKLLKDSGTAFDFYFVGKRNDDEPWRYDDCVDYCKENDLLDSVHFLGGRGDVPAILQQVDAFVYSTDHDTFGIAVVEAIAAGLPTFVNDWPVMTEITANGKYAHIYKTKDANDLMSHFSNFLSNREQYTLDAKESAKSVISTYGIEAHLNKLYEQYSKVL